MTKALITEFAKLFAGYDKAHGQHVLDGQPDETGKIKGRASTKGIGPTLREYETHLMGNSFSLGIINLCGDDTCWWGAIDIDIKGEVCLKETVEALEKRVRTMELPLVVCRSKSGGAHLYLFGSEPIPARILQAKLTKFAASLGYGGTEIFPKQVTRVNDQDRGNWINIAYYGALSKEKTTRYAIRNGKPIAQLDAFLKYAFDMRISTAELNQTDIKLSVEFSDGPPCLQYINTFGLEQGGRNMALASIGVYFKKVDEDHWAELTSQFNLAHFNPPLPQNEVQQIIRNIGRKDYFYQCKQPPLVNHCDKKLCKQRKYGIAHGEGAGELFPVDSLTRCIAKDSVRWYVEYQAERVELTTEQLFSPQMMQRLFAERFGKVILPKKGADWHLRVKELMDAGDTVIDPDDASRQGQFENLLENFFSSSRLARNRDELIKGNSYVEDGRIIFRSEDLFNYLGVRRFTYDPHEVWMWAKGMGAEAKQMRVKGKMLRVWSLPEPEKFDGSRIDMPAEFALEEL